MKKLFLIGLGLTIFLSADLSVQQIQKMVNKIHKPREGIKLETLKNTKDPFVRFKKEDNVSAIVVPVAKKAEAKLILHAIVNGKAYINDNWININDNILGYQLKFIGNRGVVLRNENHIKKLFLRKKKDSFIKIEERY